MFHAQLSRTQESFLHKLSFHEAKVQEVPPVVFKKSSHKALSFMKAKVF